MINLTPGVNVGEGRERIILWEKKEKKVGGGMKTSFPHQAPIMERSSFNGCR